MKTERFEFKMTKELFQELAEQAVKLGVSKSAFVTIALVAYMDRLKKMENWVPDYHEAN